MSEGWSGVSAVVLAGGRADDPLAAAFGVAAKALVPLWGRPLAAHVLAALSESSRVARVVYVGDPTGLEPAPEHVAAPGARLTRSVAAGLAAAMALAPDAPLLLVSADLPWLCAEGVERFLAAAPAADLVYPAVLRGAAEAQFPAQRRTYVRLREGSFTGGNLVLLRPALAPRLLELLETAYQARKNPWRLAAVIGPDLLVKLLLGRVGIAELERRVGRMLGGTVRGFVSQDASLGADVDRLEQLGQGPAPG